jgi:hypothetical protein
MQTLRVFFGTVLLVLAISGALFAQATGSISGTVTDSSGAAMVDAAVQVKNVGTGITRTVQTDDQGRYRAPELGIGDYEVSVSKVGFSTAVRTGITLTVGSNPVVDFQLQVGQQTTTVTVEGQISQVETQSTGLGALVESKQMRDLPLNGRNFTQLLTLNPGVTQIPQGAPGAGSTFYGNGQKYSIAGSRPSGQAYLIDGTDMTNFWNNGPGAGGLGSALGVEAIAEFQTLTNTYSAQFGGNGAVINASTKSGTNAFHGSLYEFLRNNVLETRNFFDRDRPPFRQNQFGGSLGGPIKRDKAFFFFNYEGLRSVKTNTNVVTVPDENAHNFIINGVPVQQNSNPQIAQAIRDTLALYPTAGIFNLLGGGLAQARVNTKTSGEQNYIVARGDYTISEKNSIFVRYINDRAQRTAPSGSNIGYWLEAAKTRSHYATVEDRHIISPTMVNLARVSFTRPYEDAYVVTSPVVENGVAKPGDYTTPGTHPLQFFGLATGRQDGTVGIGGGVTGLGGAATLPFYLVPNKFQFGDDVIWTSGSHNIKFGGSAMRMRENTWAPFQVGGVWNFNSLTAFLQGNAATVSGQLSPQQDPTSDAAKDYRYTVFAFYIDDQWKLTPRLTVNLGLRYAPTTKIGNVRHAMFDIVNTPFGLFEPVEHSTAANPSLKNWDPRIGLAWDPFNDHKTSIRASFGIFHNVLFSRDTNHWLQPPFRTTLENGPQYLGTCATTCSPFTVVPSASIPLNGTISITNGNYYGVHSTPHQYQWNFNIQREVMPNTVFLIGYVGSRNRALFAQRDFNRVTYVIGPSGRPTFSVYDPVRNQMVANPRENPQYNVFQLADNIAWSSYHALQTSLNRRFSAGWQTQVSYTWSKSIDNGSGTYGLDGGGATTNPWNANFDRGLSNFNRTHNFRASGIYELPFKASGARGVLVNGWQITGVYTYLSGAPFSVTGAANRVYNGNPAATNASRPDVIAGCDLYPSVQTIQNWFNTNCYTPQPVGTHGTLGRSTLIGPNLWNLDASVTKDFRIPQISEQFVLQFRGEMFNVLNHPSFQNPNSAVFNAALNAGATSPNNPNNNILGGTTRNTNAGVISATNSQPRQIQLALKIIF